MAYTLIHTPHVSEYDSPEVKAAKAPTTSTFATLDALRAELDAHCVPRRVWDAGLYGFGGDFWKWHEVAETDRAAHATREGWLLEAVEALAPLFTEIGRTVPAVRVSCGWPGGRGKKSTTIGQCWASSSSADETREMFISPVLAAPVKILATLVHEMCHAVDDCKSGHGDDFAKMARRVGLTGKLTSTVAGDALGLRLAEIADRLGAYPHAAMLPGSGGEKKQTTRMIKCECGECGYTARTTRKWLDEVGAPLCPCNREAMEIA